MGCISSKTSEDPEPQKRQLKQKDIDKILQGIKYQQEQAAQEGNSQPTGDGPAIGFKKITPEDSTPTAWLTPRKTPCSHSRTRSMQYMGCYKCHKFSCYCSPVTTSPKGKTPISSNKVCVMPGNK